MLSLVLPSEHSNGCENEWRTSRSLTCLRQPQYGLRQQIIVSRRKSVIGSHKYFINRDCEYFPCHKEVDPSRFNCLFCFCPFYHDLECPGCYDLLPSGIKDCSNCKYPHNPDNYDKIIKRCATLCTRYLGDANCSIALTSTLKKRIKVLKNKKKA